MRVIIFARMWEYVQHQIWSLASVVQDHPAALASWICKEEWRPKSITDEMVTRKGNIRVSAVLKYLLGGRGPLSSTGCDHGALVNTRGDGGQPDLQMRFVPAAPPLADGVNAYAEFGKIKQRGEYWPGGWTLQLLGIRPKWACLTYPWSKACMSKRCWISNYAMICICETWIFAWAIFVDSSYEVILLTWLLSSRMTLAQVALSSTQEPTPKLLACKEKYTCWWKGTSGLSVNHWCTLSKHYDFFQSIVSTLWCWVFANWNWSKLLGQGCPVWESDDTYHHREACHTRQAHESLTNMCSLTNNHSNLNQTWYSCIEGLLWRDIKNLFSTAVSATKEAMKSLESLCISSQTIQHRVFCRSKGRVVLRSDDPYDAPRMDPRYLSDADGADLATLRYEVPLICTAWLMKITRARVDKPMGWLVAHPPCLEYVLQHQMCIWYAGSAKLLTSTRIFSLVCRMAAPSAFHAATQHYQTAWIIIHTHFHVYWCWALSPWQRSGQLIGGQPDTCGSGLSSGHLTTSASFFMEADCLDYHTAIWGKGGRSMGCERDSIKVEVDCSSILHEDFGVPQRCVYCREGIKISRRFAETSAMKPITDYELHPGTKEQVNSPQSCVLAVLLWIL